MSAIGDVVTFSRNKAELLIKLGAPTWMLLCIDFILQTHMASGQHGALWLAACVQVCVCALIIIQIKYRTAVAKSAPCGRALLRFLQHDPSIQSLGAMYFDTNYYYITVIMYTIQPEPRNPKPLTETKEGLGLFRMGTTYS